MLSVSLLQLSCSKVVVKCQRGCHATTVHGILSGRKLAIRRHWILLRGLIAISYDAPSVFSVFMLLHKAQAYSLLTDALFMMWMKYVSSTLTSLFQSCKTLYLYVIT